MMLAVLRSARGQEVSGALKTGVVGLLGGGSGVTWRCCLHVWASCVLKPRTPPTPQVGDASGIQSPLSFGGFGALTRHLPRLQTAIAEALEVRPNRSSDQGHLHIKCLCCHTQYPACGMGALSSSLKEQVISCRVLVPMLTGAS